MKQNLEFLNFKVKNHSFDLFILNKRDSYKKLWLILWVVYIQYQIYTIPDFTAIDLVATEIS